MNQENDLSNEHREFACFDGIMEGKRKDDEQLEKDLDEVNSVGLVHLDLEYDGGRFSLLADNTPMPVSRLTEPQREAFVKKLSVLVENMGTNGNIESTLRCSVVSDEKVQETFFAVANSTLKPCSREREVTRQDFLEQQEPDNQSFLAEFISRDRRLAGAAVALMMVLTVFFFWHSGLVQRFSAPSAETVQTHCGPLEGLIRMTPRSSWGDYSITIHRGPEYPDSKGELDRLLKQADSLEIRAAVNAVSNGSAIYVRTEDGSGRVLSEKSVTLRQLIAGPEKTVTLSLPGHMSTRKISAALYPSDK